MELYVWEKNARWYLSKRKKFKVFKKIINKMSLQIII